MQFKKPFYSLKINSKDCGYIVCINGCYVEFHDEPSSLNIEYPINHWLQNGENSIEVYFRNTPNYAVNKKMIVSDAEISCTLSVKEHGTEKKIPLSKLNFDAHNLPRAEDGIKVDYSVVSERSDLCEGSTAAGGYTIGESGLVEDMSGAYKVGDIVIKKGITDLLCLEQKISLSIPMPEWGFLSADNNRRHTLLSDDEWDAARSELLVEYQKVQEIIADGKWSELEAILQDRCSEYDRAFYQEPGQNLKEFINELKVDLANEDWALGAVSLDVADICVAFNGKLVWMHGWDKPMSGLISLEHSKSDLAKQYPYTFAKINGQWKVVR